MKTRVLVLFFLISAGLSFSQDIVETTLTKVNTDETYLVIDRDRTSIQRRNLYFELGGSGGFGSFNFEWIFKEKKDFRWMLRTGISGTYVDKNNGAVLIFPVMVHGVYGQKHGLDIGIGQSFSITTRGNFFLRAPLSIGYRLEPESSRFFYRFSYTPIISYLVDQQWEHWGGISIGYKLKPKYKMK